MDGEEVEGLDFCESERVSARWVCSMARGRLEKSAVNLEAAAGFAAGGGSSWVLKSNSKFCSSAWLEAVRLNGVLICP